MLLTHGGLIQKQCGGMTSPSHSIMTLLLWLKDGMQLAIMSSESLESLRSDLKNLRPQVMVAILQLMVAIMLMKTVKKKTEKWYEHYMYISFHCYDLEPTDLG